MSKSVSASIRQKINIKGHVLAIVRDANGKEKSRHETHNIVMDAGDLYYGELGVAGTQPTNFTTAVTPFPCDAVAKMYKTVSVEPTAGNKGLDLSGLTGKADPTSGSTEKALSSGYPTVNDSDTDNTGRGASILTYKFVYGAADWNDVASFDDFLMTNPSPGAAEAILMWADGLGVVKTASDTVTIYVNHDFTGS